MFPAWQEILPEEVSNMDIDFWRFGCFTVQKVEKEREGYDMQQRAHFRMEAQTLSGYVE